MTSIVRATKKDFQLLSEIAKLTFVESHANSATPEDINIYVNEKYSHKAFEEELSDAKNIYYTIYHKNRAAGYSKIIFDTPYPGSQIKNIAKLERFIPSFIPNIHIPMIGFYLLKEFYDLKLGLKLFQFNIELSKTNNQNGIWLFVWKENQRAVNFYKRSGFLIIGSHDFKISETHSNPNHQMFLRF